MDNNPLGDWVGRLDAPPGPKAELVTSGPGIDPHVTTFPAGVIRWAATAANDVVEHCVEVVPIFAAGSPQTSGLHSEIEAALLGLLSSIQAGGVSEPSLTWFQDSTAQAFIQWRIPLTDVWASLMQSHAFLASRLMRECVALTDPTCSAQALTELNEITLEFINRLATLLANIYAMENERMIASALAVRQEAVELVLSGDDTDLDEASRSLRYDIANRHHIAIMVWHDLPVGDDASALQQAAKEWLAASGSEQALFLPQGRAMLWAWGNRRGAFADDRLQKATISATGARVAVGMPGVGAHGFRQSHIDAGQVHRIASGCAGLGGTVTTFDSVALWSVFSPDNDAVSRFVELELGPLAARDPYVADLRATLRVFLETHSPQAAATQLYLARNTINYRLRRAEELLGRPLTTRPLELWVALMLIERLHVSEAVEEAASHAH